ncbi:DUF6752 domain-containing protein [Nocardioides houyundeii]|uniref:DUF6752 domain-containing protein n=1 Tax=Nocardioides houyundeii TaxID=2045452 RepID=UPI0013B3F45A|nr:DUF6752 domain-containing protein [Nocardioides houyundeii]
MTEVVYLHVGGPKSGTTFLQQVLETNSARLAEAGTLVVGPRLEAIHASMVVREDPRLDRLPELARGSWDRLVAQIRAWRGPAAVLSYELFAGASIEQVRVALGALEGLQVHVLVTARDLGKSIPSAWQEQLKFGLIRPLERWQPPAESAPESEWGWRTMQPANVAARWGVDLPADQVHVITVPSHSRDSSELWRRFAQACGLSETSGLDLAVTRVNESLGLVEAELLRRVNKALDGRVQAGRQRSLWIRDVLAHQVLAGIGHEPIGLTPEHLELAREQAEEAITAIRAAGYLVHGDLEDLRPQAPPARLPKDVTEEELLEAAVLALADLLVWARDAGSDPRGAKEPGVRPVARPRGLAAARGMVGATLRRAAAPVRDRRVAELEARIAELEGQVHASRALHLRVATLTDLVEELLLPADLRDGELTMSAVREFRQRSL